MFSILSASLVPWAALAETVRAPAPVLAEGESWLVLELRGAEVPRLSAERLESGTFWDLRPAPGAGRIVRWSVERRGAERAACAYDESGARRGCRLFRGVLLVGSDLPGEAFSADEVRSTRGEAALVNGAQFTERALAAGRLVRQIDAVVVGEGVVLVPAGPREALLVRETVHNAGASERRYRFLDGAGRTVALLEGVALDRAELLSSPAPLADNGIEIRYPEFHQTLMAGATGFLQYTTNGDTALTAMQPAWTSVANMISIDQTAVPYQPDPGDPGSAVVLPEVWDFSVLQKPSLTRRTFDSTRNDAAGIACAASCAVANLGANPPDGTWQGYLKLDRYAAGGSRLTRDVFLLNDNDTGANPSIDVPFVSQDELNSDDWTQACFQQSAGGVNRFLRFFRFTGPDPASATLGVGDQWTSGAWTECDDSHGLRLTVASTCGAQCWPGCSTADPRARGMLGAGAGFRMTALEDGWVKVAAGNYLPALLLRQDTDLQAGLDFISLCQLGSQRQYAFDYFWVHRKYGLLATVSSLTDASATMPPDNWSALGNMTDGADFTWGPFPPFQTQARACLSGTLVSWSLPADGSNLNGEPNVSDYGYVVSWGSADDPEALADWNANPNHTPLPGQAGYLAAPAGSEPTSTVITGWPGAAIRATVVSALRYTDPDVHDVRSYRSAALYKVLEDPARLAASAFQVGNAVSPFVTRSGANLQLAWPAVAGASGYRLRVWDLATKAEIACPAGLDCNPATPAATHLGAGSSAASYGYRAYAVDPCGERSAN
ncbi:MAG TPA: hypothetical protein VJS92_09970 [Candidatus Polarisedimenticolaceae bacterium]|nr:hypothetical protein [Candidatus Polarisedimenticolaceae bacterium]